MPGQTPTVDRSVAVWPRLDRLGRGNEGRRLGRQIKHRPYALDSFDGLGRRTEPQLQFAPETIHASGDVNQMKAQCADLGAAEVTL